MKQRLKVDKVLILMGVTCSGKTELGKIEVKSNAQNGENVNIMVRPDDITINKKKTGNGFVVQREYRGMYYIYSVKLNSGKVVLISSMNDL